MPNHVRPSAITFLVGAILAGATIGVGSMAITPGGRADIADRAKTVAIATVLKRQREPQPGDHWGGCNEARAAGTAPIYRGEPGYRSSMDGDDDGIACEPYRGQ